jgi:hypothetical protein
MRWLVRSYVAKEAELARSGVRKNRQGKSDWGINVDLVSYLGQAQAITVVKGIHRLLISKPVLQAPFSARPSCPERSGRALLALSNWVVSLKERFARQSSRLSRSWTGAFGHWQGFATNLARGRRRIATRAALGSGRNGKPRREYSGSDAS